ncbi:MAG: capsule assembly Wzi family protein, partial [Candidatus Eisenbacteria bacterium]|nr:capsule assembly Wzi family protein [Candidatus Eisenbacteria bacterium]
RNSSAASDVYKRQLVWSRGRTEVRAGLTRLFWGDGNEGSLLLGRTAPAFDRLSIRTIRPWTFGGSRSAARFHASLFLGYLEERDRVVPYPLLHGQRLEWEPAGWAKLSLARTILFGGSGRTEKLTLRDIGDILLGRNENRVGPRSAADSDQKASIGLELRTPREWLEGKWFEGARLFWEYGGEDSFQGPLPTAVAHHYGLSALVAGWTVLAETAETWDDANDWYEDHLVYGERDYYYRGYVMGHPMGGDAVSVHASLWSPPWNQNRAQLWWRLRTIHSPEPGAHRERSATLGGALRRSLDERTIAEARFETSYAPDGEGDGHPDPPVAWRATIGLRRGFPSPWAR